MFRLVCPVPLMRDYRDQAEIHPVIGAWEQFKIPLAGMGMGMGR